MSMETEGRARHRQQLLCPERARNTESLSSLRSPSPSPLFPVPIPPKLACGRPTRKEYIESMNENKAYHRRLRIVLGCLVPSLAVLRLYKAIGEGRTILNFDPTEEVARCSSPCTEPNAPILDMTVEVARFSSSCPETDAPQLPIPVILICRGRSGSASTFGIMSNLTGQEIQSTEEDELEATGRNFDKNREFFKTHKNEKWLIDLICQKRKQLPMAGVIGIKWKLEPEMLGWSGVTAAFRFIAASSDLPVKIIRSRRNHLDTLISRKKHQQHAELAGIPHCVEGKEDCLKLYRESSSGIYVRTVLLHKTLRSMIQEDDMIDEFLELNGIPHLLVSYEKLYGNVFGNESAAVAEWKRVFEFLGRGPVNELTFAKLLGAQSLKPTFLPAHNVSLSNYNDVKTALSNTELEGLLH